MSHSKARRIGIEELIGDLDPVARESLFSLWSNWIFFTALYIVMVVSAAWLSDLFIFHLSFWVGLGIALVVGAAVAVFASALPGPWQRPARWAGVWVPIAAVALVGVDASAFSALTFTDLLARASLMVVVAQIPTVFGLIQASRAAPVRMTLLGTILLGWAVSVVLLTLITTVTPTALDLWMSSGLALVGQFLLLPLYQKILTNFCAENLVGGSELFPSLAKARKLSRLRPGDSAPRAKAGQKTWLIFYRYAGCPLCLLHLSEISARAAWLAQVGVRVVLVFESKENKFATVHAIADGTGFEFISDPEGEIYKTVFARKSWLGMFRVEVAWTIAKALRRGISQGSISGPLSRLPTHFLIGENGKIADAFYGKHAADNLPWARVEKFIYGTK